MADEFLNESRMPLWQHLDELRSRLIRCLIAVMAAFCFTYYFSDRLVHFLERPLLDVLPPADARLYFTGITDKFMVYVHVSFLAALGLASPYLLQQLWTFVAPALHRHEKRFVVPFVIFGSVAFAVGMAFAFTVVIPYGYKFLIEFGSPTDKALITLTAYFSLTLKLMFAIGLIFELPVVLMLLAKFGVIPAGFLAKHRAMAFFISSIVAGVVTPTPDAFTMILVMIPLYLLYEVSIVGVKWVQRT